MVLLRRSRRFDLLLHLYGGTSQHTHTHTLSYTFPKIKFSKFFGPFPGALGLLPTIFEFPYSRYMTSNFFRRFYPIFMVFLRRSRRFDLLLHLYGDTSQHTHFPILCQKLNFQKFLGPWAFAHHFRIPLLPLHDLKFFPTFLPHFSWSYSGAPDVSTYFYIYTAAPHNTHFPILFPKNQIFKKIFGPFPRAPGTRRPHLRIPLPASPTLGFFPASPSHL